MTKEESIIRVDASFNTLAYIREQIIKGYSLEDIDNHCKATMEACTKQLRLHNVVVPKGTLVCKDDKKSICNNPMSHECCNKHHKRI